MSQREAIQRGIHLTLGDALALPESQSTDKAGREVASVQGPVHVAGTTSNGGVVDLPHREQSAEGVGEGELTGSSASGSVPDPTYDPPMKMLHVVLTVFALFGICCLGAFASRLHLRRLDNWCAHFIEEIEE